MSVSRTLLILLAFVCFSFIQKSKDKPTDKYVAQVNKNLKEKKLAKKKFENMSRLGGAVTGYYLNNQLVLIKTCYQGPVGYRMLDFYIQHDSLVFVEEIAQFYNDSIGDAVFITDKNGNKHLSGKYPLEKDDKNLYYISDTTIIDFSLKSFGKPQKAFEDKIAAKNKEIIQHYRSHLKELKD